LIFICRSYVGRRGEWATKNPASCTGSRSIMCCWKRLSGHAAMRSRSLNSASSCSRCQRLAPRIRCQRQCVGQACKLVGDISPLNRGFVPPRSVGRLGQHL
jgi:hypothetical protein